MNITFHGAAGEVTGSKHLLQTENHNLLLDCGMNQGRRLEAYKRNIKLPFDPKKIDNVILSHAHLDHCGMLPVLVREGFLGNIYATPATAEIAEYILRDSARIQEQDVRYICKNVDINDPCKTLYTEEDAIKVQSYIKPVPYFRLKPHWTSITDNIKFKYLDAGHILGSAMPVIEITEKNKTIRVGFSGDIGTAGNPLLHDPEVYKEELDVLILESTYGSRNHRPIEQAVEDLVLIIKETAAKKGKIIIPAFALGRTQQLIYTLHKLTDEGRIPRMPIYIDSPLAINITEVFKRHEDNYKATADEGFAMAEEDPLSFRNLEYVETADESKSLNTKKGPFIVIASSGMAEGGRIMHHLDHHISDPKATVIITGYQAENTLGRKIQDGINPIKIYGSPHRVKAKIVTLDEFSAHADHDTLLNYLKLMPLPKQIFLVHGEQKSAKQFKDALLKQFPSLKVTIPELGQDFVI